MLAIRRYAPSGMTTESDSRPADSADRSEPEPRPDAPTGMELPVRIRPAVAAVLAIGAVIAVASLILDPPPEVRYGLVGLIAVLYFLTKVRHWL